MDIKELIDSLSKFDEMEAPDGMNITEEWGGYEEGDIIKAVIGAAGNLSVEEMIDTLLNIVNKNVNKETMQQIRNDYLQFLEPNINKKEYPESNQVEEALYRLAACYQALGLTHQAGEVFQQLKAKYPKSEWIQVADKLF